MSILTGPAIVSALQNSEIEISPYSSTQVNPNSYDLRLGDSVAVYERWVVYDPTAQDPVGASLRPVEPNFMCGVLDTKKEPKVLNFKIGEAGWILKPGIGYLMHTHERVSSSKYVSCLDGKSSLGRLFIKCHETAGYIDIGFDGQITLEVTAVHPIRVYAGMLFCQIRFHEAVGDIVDYKTKGSYTGNAAFGPTPSRIYKSFK